MDMMGESHRRDKQTAAIHAALSILTFAFKKDMDVVLDECNLFPAEHSLFTQLAHKHGCRIEWKVISTPLEECKRRDALKEHPTGDMMMDRLWEKYHKLLE